MSGHSLWADVVRHAIGEEDTAVQCHYDQQGCQAAASLPGGSRQGGGGDQVFNC